MPNPSEMARTEAEGPLVTADLLREAKGHVDLAYKLLRDAWATAQDKRNEYDIDAIANALRPRIVDMVVVIDRLETQ